MTQEEKNTIKKILQEFCSKDEYRKSMAKPYYTDGIVYATDGYFLLTIDAEHFGFTEKDFPHEKDVKPLNAKAIFQSDKEFVGYMETELLCNIMDNMEADDKVTNKCFANIQGEIVSYSNIKKLCTALLMFGADSFVVAKDTAKFFTYLYDKGKIVVSMAVMGVAEEKYQYECNDIITDEYRKLAYIDLQRGLTYIPQYYHEQEEKEKEFRRTHRDIYLVPFEKIVYVPVYAHNEEEAREIADKQADAEDYDWDATWELGDIGADTMDAVDASECSSYKDGIYTEDGLVDWETFLCETAIEE